MSVRPREEGQIAKSRHGLKPREFDRFAHLVESEPSNACQLLENFDVARMCAQVQMCQIWEDDEWCKINIIPSVVHEHEPVNRLDSGQSQNLWIVAFPNADSEFFEILEPAEGLEVPRLTYVDIERAYGR